MTKQPRRDAGKHKGKSASKQDAGMQAKAHEPAAAAQGKSAVKSRMNKSELISKP